jgi:SAM-dependent methyltransferase
MQENTFEQIYRTGFWKSYFGTESGPGSSIECSKQYLDFVQQFCVDNNIKSILDLGCGDFNLMRHFNFDGIVYHGVDVVDFVIQNNIQKYGTPTLTFESASIINYTPKQKYDLVLCKDVLQHLPTNDVVSILNILTNNLSLVANDYAENCNQNVPAGKYSPVDLSKPPYSVAGQYVFHWQSCTFPKKVYRLN